MIENFNSHYQNQIINIREFLLSEIIKLLENYALKNNVDLILDSNSYLIASNSLDITNLINNELENLNFKLEYKDFEKIKFIDIKKILEKNLIEINSKISDNEIFLSIKTISNSTNDDLTFFSNLKYLSHLKK